MNDWRYWLALILAGGLLVLLGFVAVGVAQWLAGTL